MILLTITVIFLVLYSSLIFYYWKAWNKLHQFESSESKAKTFISVIVPARNEEKTLSFLLKALSRQSFPTENFEIIVVDDYSDDSTSAVVKKFPLSNLVLIQPNVESKYSSKKRAIDTGIEFAKGELIVTTDADCIPETKWLETINNFFVETNAVFIAAPVKFSHNKTFLELFQCIDFLVLQGITAASVSADFHIMCNGANLAYTKSAFKEVNGFEGIDKVATGDDMLLMYKIKQKNSKSVFYLKSKGAVVTTQPMHSWKEFFMQRKRWASKTFVYDDYRIIAVLSFVYLFNCLFIALIVASFFNGLYWWYVLGFCIVKTIIEFPFVFSVSKFYNEQSLMKYFFLFQPVHIFYTVVVGLFSQFGKYEWKGRKTK